MPTILFLKCLGHLSSMFLSYSFSRIHLPTCLSLPFSFTFSLSFLSFFSPSWSFSPFSQQTHGSAMRKAGPSENGKDNLRQIFCLSFYLGNTNTGTHSHTRTLSHTRTHQPKRTNTSTRARTHTVYTLHSSPLELGSLVCVKEREKVRGCV